MPAPSGIRLRDSCQSCAASKIKCSKDKPQCSRCADRGTACQYLVTQRTGRKVRSRSHSKVGTTQQPTPGHLSPATSSSLERGSTPEFSLSNSQFGPLDAAILGSGAHDYFSMLPVDLHFSSPVQSYANAIDSSDLPSEYTLGFSRGDSHGSSRGSSRGGLAAEDHILNQPGPYFQSEKAHLSGHDPGAHDGAEPNSTNPVSYTLPHEQLFQELGNFQSQTLSPQPEGIKMALQLMGQLCQEDCPSFDNLSPSELEHRANTLVDESKVVTETINGMLQCPGSDDGYFLAVVCLVMSKVLDAYVKAAKALGARERDSQTGLGPSTSSALSSWPATRAESASGASPTTKGRDPKAVQLLLDDLYQVRTSMNHLGAKIVLVCSKRDWLMGGNLTPMAHDHALPTFPFSGAILNQLYDELRRRLSAISLQFIDELKQFWVQ